jgi:23S rRNA (guanosine2251-2'-O)-methyltransferase
VSRALAPEPAQAGDLVIGPHAVLEALRAGGRLIERIVLARRRPDQRIDQILGLAAAKGVRVDREPRGGLDRFAGRHDHRGVVAVAGERRYEDPYALAARVSATATCPLLVLLDQIQDPQNLGAIMRIAEAAGVDGLFIGKHRAVGVTAAVSRASAGAAEYLPVAQVGSLAGFLEWLKARGLWIVGADADAEQSLYGVDLNAGLAVVIGGEHRGLRKLVRARCDLLVSIPMCGRVASLNAAAAAAVLLFEVRRQRDAAPQGRENRLKKEMNPA